MSYFQRSFIRVFVPDESVWLPPNSQSVPPNAQPTAPPLARPGSATHGAGRGRRGAATTPGAHPDDLVFEDQGVKVYVDPESFPVLDGTKVDFVRQGLNESFQFLNPNVKAECGCGESFTV